MPDKRSPRIGILEEMTLPEVKAFGPEIVVIPIGSTEPHGPHLAYCTDTLATRDAAERGTVLANERGTRALCYPTLPITLNTNVAFPFALSLRVSTFLGTLRDLCEQIERQGVRRILLVNGHGGNTSAIGAFLRDWAHRGTPGTPGAADRAFVCCITNLSPRAAEVVEHASEHGGEEETLEVLAARPELVRMDKLADLPWGKPAVGILRDPHVAWARAWHLHCPESAGGDSRAATPEKAARLAQLNAEWIADVICDLCSVPWSDRYPYS